MKRLQMWFVIMILGASLIAPWPCSAQTPETRDLPLVPVGSQGFVDLLAFQASYELNIAGEQWKITAKHTYRLHNTDKIKAATLRLGVEQLPNAESEAGPILKDVNGNVLVPIGMDADHPLIWEIQIPANQQSTLEYSYSTAPSDAILVNWSLASSRLGEWGIVQGTHVSWRLPAFFADQVFLTVSPSNPTFDGREVTWSAENVNAAEDIAIKMWSPQLWTERQRLLANGDHAELGRFYANWAERAAELDVEIDLTLEILGEYQAALSQDDQDLTVRNALAEIYLDLASRNPSTRLNYLVIAAQELEAIHEADPDETQVVEQLVQIYDQAAALAGAMGDPVGALAYLTKPVTLSAQATASDLARREELALQWALDLAEQGQIDQALVQLSGRLAPAIQDAIMRYAPPCMSAATHVMLTDHRRTVNYDFYLYLPTAERTGTRLGELVEQLAEIEQCTAKFGVSDTQATISIEVTFDSLQHLATTAAEISESLAQDPDLISALLRSPWQSSADTWHYSSSLWQDRFVYQEHIDNRSVDTLWQTAAQYAEWRLVELDGTPIETERARMETRLAQIALNEQHLIWQNLPQSSYWVYAIAPEKTPLTKETLVPWGQQRVLEAVHSVYRWRAVTIGALVAGSSLVALVVGALLVGRKKLR